MKLRSQDFVIGIALALALSYGSWLFLRTHLELGASWTDGETHYARPAGERIRYAVWDEPELLAPDGNGGDSESRPAISPDGRFLVYSTGERHLNADLWIASLVDGRPLDPRPLAAVNSGFDELAPAFGPDALYFATDRSGLDFGLDLWRAPYDSYEGTFGEPEPIGMGINSPADETDPFPVPQSSTLLFASNRTRGARTDFDLYEARRLDDPDRPSYVSTRVEAWNTPFDEREPALTSDGRTLLFASNRAGSAGSFDLFRSFREEGGWLPPEPLGSLNGPGSERGPLPSRDGFSLLFEGSREGSPASLFRARSKELFRVPAPPIGMRELIILALLLALALLCWLAKRWTGLEILTRCILASLILHLLLMWYLREVYPESAPVVARNAEATFRVRLAPSSLGSPAAAQERGGELETAREPVPLDAAPARMDAQHELAEFTPAVAATPAPTRAESAPSRRPTETQRAEQDSAETTLADRETPFEKLTERAPTLALSAQKSTTQPNSRPAAQAPERANRVESERSLAQPTRKTLTSERRAGDARESVPEPERLERRVVAEAGVETQVAQPSESFEVASGTRPSLALPASSSLAPPQRASGEPSRRDASVTERASTAGTVRPQADLLSGLDITPRREATPTGPRAELDLASTPRGEADVELREVAEVRREDGVRSAPKVAPFDPVSEPVRLEPARFSRADITPQPTRFTAVSAADRARPSARTLDFRAPVVATPAPPTTDRSDRPTLERTPYQNRFGNQKLRALEEYGGGEETEQAVAAGLRYLADIQNPNGSWGSRRDHDDKYGDVRVGKTALSLLAFMGAGHTQASGSEFSSTVRRALDFLLEEQDSRSDHFGDSNAYSHGIATYALAECFALTQDPALRAPLERGVDHILDRQSREDDERFHGGWGYYYPTNRVWNGDPWPRVSVTAWQVMALESARLGGIEVPDRAFADAREFVAKAWDPRRGAFRYSHDPDRLRSGYPILPASTPAALFSLSLLGIDIASPELAQARGFVLERAPRDYRYTSDDDFVYDARGNLYFWYYGTLSMFRAGGNDWRRWNAQMKETLLEGQDTDGSWDPISIYSRYAGDDENDKSYSTAMCVLTLEVYYRYFTPLLEVR